MEDNKNELIETGSLLCEICGHDKISAAYTLISPVDAEKYKELNNVITLCPVHHDSLEVLGLEDFAAEYQLEEDLLMRGFERCELQENIYHWKPAENRDD